MKSSQIELCDIPSPALPPKSGFLIVKTSKTLLSPGTDRMIMEFGNSNWIQRAQQQPNKVKQVLEKAKLDGPLAAYEAVINKLDEPINLGYSNVGEVVAVGENVKDFKVGDRVVSNGPHAEFITISKKLCAKIPEQVSDDCALFTILGAISLQGTRLIQPTYGETFLVSGFGLIGLLTSQILISSGCNVIGSDPDPEKCKLAELIGVKIIKFSQDINEMSSLIYNETNGVGVDGALICTATKSNQPLELASNACRKKGRIVLIGTSGININRDLFYDKELSFQVSCSYGPGRYDDFYEISGHDYPLSYVRWTEKRNFEAILNSMANGKINTKDLVTHRFEFNDAKDAFNLLSSDENYLGIIIQYKFQESIREPLIDINKKKGIEISRSAKNIVDFIGCGNYGRRILIPAFKKSKCTFNLLVSQSGFKTYFVGKKFNFNQISTEPDDVFKNKLSNTVVISTRHDTHAEFVKKSIKAGKNVFVEKPLCLTMEELDEIENLYKHRNHSNKPLLMIGYNRRFSPLILEIKKLLSIYSGPRSFIYTCNAGFISSNHWIQNKKIGGGRLLGEACHFVDLLYYLAGSKIQDISLNYMRQKNNQSDTFTIQLSFMDGSIGSIHYFSNGSNSFPKEKLEIFTSGKIILLNNFKKLEAWGIPGFINKKLFTQDKGQKACVSAFLDSIKKGNESPIPINDIFDVQKKILTLI